MNAKSLVKTLSIMVDWQREFQPVLHEVEAASPVDQDAK